MIGPVGPPGPAGPPGPNGAQGPIGASPPFADWLVRFSDYELLDGDLAAFNRAMVAVPSGGTILFDRDGPYLFTGTLSTTKPVTLWGGRPSEVAGDQELVFSGSTGIRVNSGDPSVLRDLTVRSTAGAGTPAEQHGVHATARVCASNVSVVGFPGSGFFLRGSSGEGSNVSHSILTHCQATGQGLCGVEFDGPDANVITVHALEATGNGVRGVVGRNAGALDSSFLGNVFVACVLSGNAVDVLCTGGNTRTIFQGCRADTATITNPSIVLGGAMPQVSGCKLVGSANGFDMNSTEWRRAVALDPALRIGEGSDVLYNLSSDDVDAVGYRMQLIKSAGVTTHQMRHAGVSERVAHTLSTAQGTRGAGMLSSARLVVRTARFASGTLALRPTITDPGNSDVWQVGDLWWNSEYAAGTPFWWKVSDVTAGVLTWVDGPNQS